MAVTTLEKNGFIQLIWTDSSDVDWSYAADTPAYAKLGYLCSAVAYHAGAASDVLVVNEGGIDGPSGIHWELSGASDDRIRYFDPPKWIRPYIEYTDQTFSDPTNNKVVFTLV